MLQRVCSLEIIINYLQDSASTDSVKVMTWQVAKSPILLDLNKAPYSGNSTYQSEESVMHEEENETHATACLLSRVSSMRNTLDHPHDETVQDELDNILEIRRKLCFEILLSWGGPSEWVRIIVDNEEIEHISFHYANWFYVQEVALDHDQEEVLRDWAHSYILPLLDLSS